MESWARASIPPSIIFKNNMDSIATREPQEQKVNLFAHIHTRVP